MFEKCCIWWRWVFESKPTKRIPLIICKHSLDYCKFIEGVHNVEVPAIVKRGSAVTVMNAETNGGLLTKKLLAQRIDLSGAWTLSL